MFSVYTSKEHRSWAMLVFLSRVWRGVIDTVPRFVEDQLLGCGKIALGFGC